MHTRGFLFLLLLIPLIDSFWDKGGDDGYGGGGGKGKGGGGKGSGTACTVKGSYCQVKRIFNFHISFARIKITHLLILCQCHYCKCESGYLNCGYGHGHGGYDWFHSLSVGVLVLFTMMCCCCFFKQNII